METRISRSQRSGILLAIFMLFHSCWMNAQQSPISKKLGLSGSEMNSVYILGGVLIVGIVGYFVYSMIDKNRKDGKPSSRRPVSHRHHHHHRVIKKSA
jgi:heme/copper-type cytochrome/quinol oxidase subunit 2